MEVSPETNKAFVPSQSGFFVSATSKSAGKKKNLKGIFLGRAGSQRLQLTNRRPKMLKWVVVGSFTSPSFVQELPFTLPASGGGSTVEPSLR